MKIDVDAATLISDLILLAWFLSNKWAETSELPEDVEERQGDFMGLVFRAGAALKDAGYPAPDIDSVVRADFRFPLAPL